MSLCLETDVVTPKATWNLANVEEQARETGYALHKSQQKPQ